MSDVSELVQQARMHVFAIYECEERNSEDPDDPLCEACNRRLMGDGEDDRDNVNALLWDALTALTVANAPDSAGTAETPESTEAER